ncbi:pyruvate dehydrogenase (acetyl-transferring) E1 component subunit alpha [Meiothermus sp. QL-1]|uniref:pyruvate dehydrogenase (acetyl-transferring) E1 component subunit alpha n=1 Tax=Meiothermus sp. QL-1 TaxID=2058095 RepID=UPI000E0AB440|nr:pyruvate dehydrogenase (acetyl-transferring) E1 component subunit alpha [Meiothermus sp. QL-1]RDI95012.1 pyruvate dehydrogenase (acetyl-transferring) E1 component subunit alpha [Meiothermus sp. QL-1]
MDTVQYLDDTGRPLQALPLGPEELIQGYRALRRARHFDEKAVLLQRQGRLGVYPPFRGQEAAQVGVALCLRAEHDWLLPSYRETAAALTFGMPIHKLILSWRADPAGWGAPPGVNMVQFYIPIATQIPQAAGVAYAQRLLGKDAVAAVFIGDGGTSEGDFHEGLNFAAVFSAPLLVVVQNNGWAISVPTRKQMKVERIALRAQGYGIPGVVVDGNDLVAVWSVAKAAVERARRGEGPTLIEALTYRVAPHTTSDDPSRYRSEEEARRWEARDPIRRMKNCLLHLGLWSEEEEARLNEELEAEFEAELALADRAPEPRPWEIVEQVYQEMQPDQLAAWRYLRGEA